MSVKLSTAKQMSLKIPFYYSQLLNRKIYPFTSIHLTRAYFLEVRYSHSVKQLLTRHLIDLMQISLNSEVDFSSYWTIKNIINFTATFKIASACLQINFYLLDKKTECIKQLFPEVSSLRKRHCDYFRRSQQN